MSKINAYYTIVFFFVAGLAEVGGGYLIWQAVRGRAPVLLGVWGGAMMVIYGLIAALQPATFGRAYATYGGVFVVMSLLWGWYVEKIRPDLYDFIGVAFVICGIAIMYYTPRKA